MPQNHTSLGGGASRSRTAPRASVAEGQPPKGRWAALGVLCVTVLIANLDNTVLNVALPTLARDLNASSSDLQWIVDSYIMVYAGLLLAAGSLADRIGRKRTFLMGLAAFAGGSAWAAFSGSVGLLIAARASMGIGGALLAPSTLSILTDMFRDPGERQHAIGLWTGTSGVGVALGPIIGGLLLAHLWWGSVFLINVPIAGAGLLLAIWLVPDSRNPAALAPDMTGAVLSIAGIGLILWSIIEAPAFGWSSASVIATGGAGLSLLVIFAAWERASSHPMLDLRFFRQRSFSVAISVVAMVTFGLYGMLFVLTQFLQFSLGFTPLQTGVRVLPAAAAVGIMSPASALLVRVIGIKSTVAAGLLFIAGGLWHISGTTTASTYASTVTGMIFLGIGAGLATPSATGSVMGSVPRQDSGVASATNSAFMRVGGALGVAVIGSLLATRYQARMTTALTNHHLPRQASAGSLGSLGGALAVADREGGAAGQTLAQLARDAFVSGMDLALLTSAAVVLAGCLLAVAWLPARPNAALRQRSAAGRHRAP